MTYSGNGHNEEVDIEKEYTHLEGRHYEVEDDDNPTIVDSETVRDSVDGFEPGDDNDNAESPN